MQNLYASAKSHLHHPLPLSQCLDKHDLGPASRVYGYWHFYPLLVLPPPYQLRLTPNLRPQPFLLSMSQLF